MTLSNGNEVNGNGDIPSLKDLSAEAAAVIDAVNGKIYLSNVNNYDNDKSRVALTLLVDLYHN